MPRKRRNLMDLVMSLTLTVGLCLVAVAAQAGGPPSGVQQLHLSESQERGLAIPEIYDLFLGGGRGGGKSHTLVLFALRHGELYGPNARILIVRQSYKALADMELVLFGVLSQAYGQTFTYNRSEHIFRLPNGAYIELGQLEAPGDYSKFQGRSFSLLLIDEAGQWADPSLLDLLRSNLRGPEGVPVRVVMAANPGGPGHHWIAQRYVFKAEPWVPFVEEKSGREWVYCPSLYTDNPFIDRDAYRKQIEAATATDPELGRAWLLGDWTVARGAFFGAVLEESRNAIGNWQPGSIDPRVWDLFLSYDHGSSAPAVCYVVGRSPGAWADGVFYPRDSILLLDEMATNQPGSLSKGMGYTTSRLSEEIRELAEPWRMRPDGCADDAIFSFHGSEGGSIADEFRRCDVYFEPAGKGDRRHGWEIMRRMLADAGKPDVPGLYIARRCEYFWQTVPYLARDPRRPDDVDSRGPDHCCDATRYSLTWRRPGVQIVPIQLGGSFR